MRKNEKEGERRRKKEKEGERRRKKEKKGEKRRKKEKEKKTFHLISWVKFQKPYY